MTGIMALPAGPTSHIMVLDEALAPEVCERLLLFAMDAIPALGYPGRTWGGDMPEVKHSRDLPLATMTEWDGEWSLGSLLALGYDLPALDAAVAECIGRALHTYVAQYPPLEGIDWQDTGYQLQHYPAGAGRYTTHVDGTPVHLPGRVLSGVLYLNDVAVGGETAFPEHGVEVQPVAGRLVLFPATWTHPHGSLVPVSEDKYIISTFLGVAGEHPLT